MAAQLRLAESRREQEALSETIQELRKTLLELQAQKAELESLVEVLHLRSQCLQKQIRYALGQRLAGLKSACLLCPLRRAASGWLTSASPSLSMGSGELGEAERLLLGMAELC